MKSGIKMVDSHFERPLPFSVDDSVLLFHFFKICPIDKNLDFCVWVGANSPPPNKVGLSEKSLGIHTFNSVRRTVRRTKTNLILT